MKKVYFSGGCFWCTEHDLKHIPGVQAVRPGYIQVQNSLHFLESNKIPTYENHTGYREGVEIEYDESEVSFKKLCQFFLDSIDPTDEGGQFFDRGESYKTGIFFGDSDQERSAAALLEELEKSKIFEKPICVQLLPFERFYVAEEYHRNYSEKNPQQYMRYRIGSGREDFVQSTCRLRNGIPWKEE
jgi:peptide methionine sulfoxide reductase msrA/msrB